MDVCPQGLTERMYKYILCDFRVREREPGCAFACLSPPPFFSALNIELPPPLQEFRHSIGILPPLEQNPEVNSASLERLQLTNQKKRKNNLII